MTDVKPVQTMRKKVATLLGIILVFSGGGYRSLANFRPMRFLLVIHKQ